VAVAAALLLFLIGAPRALPAAAALPAGLKLLQLAGAAFPPAALLLGAGRYARSRSAVVLASHVMLLLGGLPLLLADALPAAGAAWLGVATAAALVALQPTRLSVSAPLVLWQALPPLLRVAAAPRAAGAWGAGAQLAAAGLGLALALKLEAADRWGDWARHAWGCREGLVWVASGPPTRPTNQPIIQPTNPPQTNCTQAPILEERCKAVAAAL
jgi:hypothetical protein